MKRRYSFLLSFALILFLCSCAKPTVQQESVPDFGEKVTEAIEQVDKTEETKNVEDTVPTPEPEENENPGGTVTPEPTAEPTPTAEPIPTPEPTAEPIPTPEPTPEPPHIHSFTEEVTTKAGCMTDGVLTRVCAACGETETEEIPAIGEHTWDKGKVTKESTCGAEGEKTFTCTLCEATKTQSIAATGKHDWKMGKTQKATCSSEGYRIYDCTVCEATKKQELPILEHIWDQGKLTKRPTKTTEGILTYTCLNCNRKKDEVMEVLHFDAAESGNPQHLRTSDNPDGYVDYVINGTTLTISGKIVMKGLNSVRLEFGQENKIFDVSSGEAFSASFSLTGVKENQSINVFMGISPELYAGFGYVCNTVKVTLNDGEYQFVPSLVQEHNFDVLSRWVDPKQYSDAKVSKELVALSDKIVGNETDDYKKLYLLNYWVADNIYYDYDFVYGSPLDQLYFMAEDVMEHKRTICEGYSNLLQALIQAQGIPCISTDTYSVTGNFTESNYKETGINHTHVEAYVNDRWVVMDATWDSRNVYKDGEFTHYDPIIRYFDATPAYFSFTHKLNVRPSW